MLFILDIDLYNVPVQVLIEENTQQLNKST